MAGPLINVLIIDNYDSFTYNIAHAVRSHTGTNIQIIEAGKTDIAQIDSFDGVIFSPGPDLPRPGNIMDKILITYAGIKPILGICLGLQAIVLFYGGRLRQLTEVAHGRRSIISKTDQSSKLFTGLPASFEAGLYHSWYADPLYLPSSLAITAVSENNRIMAVKHLTADIEAVQFHPESIMTPFGERIIHNWLKEEPEIRK